MIFNSLEFLIFLPIVLLGYFVIPNKLKNIWLLITSYYFYSCWNVKYLALIVIVTLITYIGGLLLEGIKESNNELKVKTRQKKFILTIILLLNLGILVYFKYTNFLVDLISNIFEKFGYRLLINKFDILLPIGISFFILQSLGYVIDVYKDDIYAEKDFIKYALFVSFFPQLVAGPIERSKRLIRQLSKPKKFSAKRMRDGFLLIMWGYFLKVVLADRIAIFVDTVYSDIGTFGGWYLIIATILFAFQIYCDFAGYSTIAMGSAKMLGIELIDNFNAPYLSKSVSEFWRRWHVSLSSWFKDYLYIPLGGNRCGKVRECFNKLVVFSISGLWHGADLSFIIWGSLNGFYQIVGELIKPLKEKWNKLMHLNKDSLSHKLVQTIITFVLVDFTWIFFRAETVNKAIKVLKSIVTVKNPWVLVDGSLYNCGLDRQNFMLVIYCIILLMIVDFCKVKNIKVREVIIKQDYWFRWIFIAVSIVSILTFGIWGPTYNATNFIYFQF